MGDTNYIGQVIEVDGDIVNSGVKGMKWGVRKDAGHVGQKAKTKTIAKLDKKFEKEVARTNSGSASMAYRNAAVKRINSRIEELGDSDKYRNIDLLNAKGTIKADYDRDAQAVIVRSIEDATREIYGSNASGTKKGVYNADTDRIDIVDRDVQHADDGTDVTVLLTRDDKGHIVSVEVVPYDPDLEHSGVKGMKWGVRKDNPDKAVRKADKAAQKIGERSPSSKGPESTADRYTRLLTKARAQGANSFTDEELQFVTKRGDAINKINRLNERKPNWIAELAQQQIKQTAQKQMRVVSDDMTKKYVGSKSTK